MTNPLVAKYARKYRIPLVLAEALIGQESGGAAGAVSPAGATGLTQVMPSTAAGMYGISEAQAARRLKSPDFALDAGFRYLAEQKKAFGTWRLALAAYNAGPNAVKRYGDVPPYQETQNYVRSILRKTGDLSGSPATAFDNTGTAPLPASTAPLPQGLQPQPFTPAPLDINKKPTEQLNALVQQLASQPTTLAPLGSPVSIDTSPSLPKGGNWRKWVKVPKPAGSSSQPDKPQILQTVAHLAQLWGSPLPILDNTLHSKYTVNGNVSDHYTGMAADIPMSGRRLRNLGYKALVMAGMSPQEAAKARKTGGLFNVGRYQIIFDTNEGGNHYNHLHIGLRG